MTPRYSQDNPEMILGTSIFHDQNTVSSRGTGISFPYDIKTMIKTCPGNHSTFVIKISDDLSYPHVVGAIQGGNFGGHFGSPGHGTIGAPEGSLGWRRVLRTKIQEP